VASNDINVAVIRTVPVDKDAAGVLLLEFFNYCNDQGWGVTPTDGEAGRRWASAETIIELADIFLRGKARSKDA
jgi:hypothetical protein